MSDRMQIILANGVIGGWLTGWVIDGGWWIAISNPDAHATIIPGIINGILLGWAWPLHLVVLSWQWWLHI